MRSLLLHQEEQMEASLKNAQDRPAQLRKEFTAIAMAGFPLILIDSFVILILPITILDILLAIGAFAMICNMYSCELSVRKLSRRWKENEELAQRNLDEIRKMLKEYQY